MTKQMMKSIEVKLNLKHSTNRKEIKYRTRDQLSKKNSQNKYAFDKTGLNKHNDHTRSTQ